MPNLLIHNARCVATLDHADPTRARELADTSFYICDRRIAYIGPAADLPAHALVSAQVAMAELILSV